MCYLSILILLIIAFYKIVATRQEKRETSEWKREQNIVNMLLILEFIFGGVGIIILPKIMLITPTLLKSQLRIYECNRCWTQPPRKTLKFLDRIFDFEFWAACHIFFSGCLICAANNGKTYPQDRV